MVCQECGVNTEIMRGHSKLCTQYAEPELSNAEYDEMLGVDPEASARLHAFGEMVNQVVIDRGEKALLKTLASAGITPESENFEFLRLFAHMGLSVGAGVTVQIMIEQKILDAKALGEAAGLV